MSYTNLVKQWERERKQKEKQQQKEREYEQKLNERIIVSGIMYSFQIEREREEKVNTKNKLIKWGRTKEAQALSIRSSWIIWDVVNHDYITCLNDIRRGRQTFKDVVKVIDYILYLDFIKPFKEEIEAFKSYIETDPYIS